ncbi:MAG: NAD(+)/NADH kinase [Chloroflexi bacterium]|nr:NAD(+)/NADH kinase [Chloroflexota bacterium]
MTSFSPPRRIGVVYHPGIRGADVVGDALARQAETRGIVATIEALPPPDAIFAPPRLTESDLLVCVGGDGTVLHASSYATRHDIPVFGVRMGRLGFLTETVEERAAVDFERVLSGEARIEERALVQARVDGGEPLHALNDMVIGRARLGRTISVVAYINGVTLAEYRADALIIATATGSTGYSLSVGGPILHPTAQEMVVVPVAAHLTQANAVVLPGSTTLRLSVQRGYEAELSVDGLENHRVESGSMVEVTRSSLTARFVRVSEETDFYHNVAQRLGWLRSDHVIDVLDAAGDASVRE